MTFTIENPQRCVCSHEEALHDIGSRGQRTSCSVTDRHGKCLCALFTPAVKPA